MNHLKFIYFIISMGISILAQANPPLRVDRPEALGRLIYFRGQEIFNSQGEFNYFLPSAFHSEFECHFQNEKKVRCLLKIYNELNAKEVELLERLAASTPLSDLSYQIVDKISENITFKENLFSDLKMAKTIYTKTLRLSPAPYVVSSFVTNKDQAKFLLEMYKTQGIGEYRVQVDLKATDTSFYLAVKDAQELKSRLLSLQGKSINAGTLKVQIKKAIEGMEVISLGWEDPQRTLIDFLHLKYFEKKGAAKYHLKEHELVKLQKGVEVVFDDTTADHSYVCETVLSLKEGTLPQTQCMMKD